MSNLQEMARLTKEELSSWIQPVQLLSLNPNRATGEVSGRFRSSGMLFDYSIKGGTVAYKPVGNGPARKDAEDLDNKALVQSLLASRKALKEGWSQERLDTYLEELARLDAGKNCNKGYGCGSSCIDRNKSCRVKGGKAAQQLGQIVKVQSSPREPGGQSKAQRKLAALAQRRDQLGSALVAQLKKKRPDGNGTFIEHPDQNSFDLIAGVAKRIKEVDRQMNVIEGKAPDAKRWIEGDPYGLKEFSDFQSPGRKAYEDKIIASELAEAETGDQAVFMSGGPASGKTSLLRKKFGEAKGFVVVDPDRLKDFDPVMAAGVALGMRQAAALAHENSSRLSKNLFTAAQEQSKNILMDGTGANAGKYIGQMQELKGKGYQVTLLAQHVPEAVGVQRALDRADRVGRFVPEEFIRHAYEVIPGNFERLAAAADRATLNDGESSTVIMEYEAGRLVGGDARRTAQYRRQFGRPKG